MRALLAWPLAHAGQLRAEPQPGPRLYCYAFVKWPPEATAGLLGGQLAQACDAWDLFSTGTDPSLRITKLYEQSDFTADFQNGTLLAPVTAVWRFLLQKPGWREDVGHASYEVPFDWVVKLDADSYVRPSTFRSLFAKYPADERLILSAGDGGWVHGALSGHSPWSLVDGYFDALSRGAARVLLPQLLQGSAEERRDCSVLASGHDSTKGRAHESACFARLGVRVAYPVDRGYGLVLKHELITKGGLSRRDLAALARGAPRCFGKEFNLEVKGGCVSNKFAVVHYAKSVDDYEWLSKNIL